MQTYRECGIRMNTNEALEFLRSHQPMPPDSTLTTELSQKYNEVREFFEAHPDPRCIPLFLNSFGDGDGFSAYQGVDLVLLLFSHEQVLPHLLTALSSIHPGVKSWTAEIASLLSPRWV